MTVQLGNALLIVPEEGKSQLIREIVNAFEGIERADRVANLKEALRTIEQQSFHFVFVSDSLPEHEISDFHSDLVEKPWGGDCTIILLTPTAQQARSNLIKKLLDKAHGILCEPFSLDSLRECLKIAAKVKSQAEEVKQANLIQVALVDAMTYIDARSTLMQKGMQKTFSSSAVEKLRGTLASLYAKYPEIYFDTIVDRFSHVAETTVPKDTSYSGVSTRVKKKMEKKIKEKLLESIHDLEQQIEEND